MQYKTQFQPLQRVTNYAAIHIPFVGISTAGGWHVHIAEYKTIDTCGSLNHTLYHTVVIARYLQKLLECLQHEDGKTLLLLQGKHRACKRFCQKFRPPSSYFDASVGADDWENSLYDLCVER